MISFLGIFSNDYRAETYHCLDKMYFPSIILGYLNNWIKIKIIGVELKLLTARDGALKSDFA